MTNGRVRGKGLFRVMIGTDLLNLGSIHGLGAPVASIGGRSIDRQCPTVMEAGAEKAAVGRRGSVIREHS